MMTGEHDEPGPEAGLPDLAGRTALITGASRGIGRAVAADLARAGAHVLLVARSESELREAADDIARFDGEASTITADVADLTGIAARVRGLADDFGAIDVLINNAGTVAPLGPTDTLRIADVEVAMRLNLGASIVVAGAVLSSMRERCWGRIVNISSGIVANPASMVGGGVYAATKSALEAHTLNLAAELANSGVTVNAYRPGRVDTAMHAYIRSQDPTQVGSGLVERFAAAKAADALISPERSARALVRRIGSRDTGQIWTVDDLPTGPTRMHPPMPPDGRTVTSGRQSG